MRRLLERQREIDAISSSVAAAAAGDGGVLLIEGQAGIGKSCLLAEAVAESAEAGFETLGARPTEMERELGWGVLRDLFGSALRRRSKDERAEMTTGAAALALPILGEGRPQASAGALGDLLHGVYWLVVNLCSEAPLLLAVDDLHWADDDSLRALDYLAARVDDLPLLLAFAARPDERRSPVGIEAGIGERSRRVVLRPQTLSEQACTALVGQWLGSDADPALSSACREATGGNPFLLNELLEEMAGSDLQATAEIADEIRELRPDAVRRAVLTRVARTGQAALELTNAVAVFGGGVGLHAASTVAQIDPDGAATMADRLAAAHVLAPGEPLGFVHPLVRSVVYGEIPALRRGFLHRRAADTLLSAGASPEQVAVHLLAAPGEGDPEVVDHLVRAGSSALARGAFDAAARYLRRALEEPCPPDRRTAILLDLGRAEARSSGGPAAAALFREAFEAETDPGRRARIALEHSRTLRMISSFTAPAELLQAAAEQLEPGTELAWEVEGELLNVALLDLNYLAVMQQRLTEISDRLDLESIRAPGLLADLAIMHASVGQSRELAVDLARRALQLVAETHETDPSAVVYANNVLLFADELDEARDSWTALLNDPEWRRSQLATGFASLFRSDVQLRAGALAEAEADARLAFDIYARFGSSNPDALVSAQPPIPETHALLIWPLIERGELDEAEHIAQLGWEAERLPELWVYNRYLESRGWLRVVRGETERGLVDLRECGRRQTAWGSVNPAVLPWRSRVALALLALGEHDEAERLAFEELELARVFGAPRAIGVALRAAGLIRGGTEGIDLLREASTVLERSPARLEYARAAFELGRAVRHAGRPAEARDHLRAALHFATECGAQPLAETARAELAAAGGKPRRERIKGREALTASELRVARMAADGMRNKEIAQALFVSMRTVETHLTHAYQKLDISARAELVASLA